MSDPIRTTLERVKELDKKSTEGPWVLGANDPSGNRYIGSLCHDCWPPCQVSGGLVATAGEGDSELIAEYRTLAPQLARALEAVLEVHQPFIWDFGYGPLESCKGCADQGAGDHDYPCPTVRAITEHLGGVL